MIHGACCADGDAEEVEVEEDMLEQPKPSAALMNFARSMQDTEQEAGDVLEDDIFGF